MDLVKAYQEMWKTALGVEVILVPVKSGAELYKYIEEKKPGLSILGVWIADYIDPHNFTFDTFLHPDTPYPQFIDKKFEELVAKAEAAVNNPSERQLLYVEAEKILCEDWRFCYSCDSRINRQITFINLQLSSMRDKHILSLYFVLQYILKLF